MAVNLYHDIPLTTDNFETINAVLEIPKGSYVKYEFDYKTGAIWVDRVGKTPIPYNFNYGDLPQTWNTGDNDPLDVIILCSYPLAVGTVVPARVVGGLRMIDSGEYDYKILAVADDKHYAHIKDISDVSLKELEDIEYFMLHYKDLHGKKVEIDGWDPKAKAQEVLKTCHEEYLKRQKSE